MGTATSKERKTFRPFDTGEFTLAWLTFKGDAVETEDHRQAAKKDGLLSSKLLRGLFGDVTMKCFQEREGEYISREAFICILALCYEGNTEDRICYLFSMYSTIYGLDPSEETSISENDYLYLLDYLETFNFIPKKFYSAFEDCMIPSGTMITSSQFIEWVRQFPVLLEFLVNHLPPSTLPTPTQDGSYAGRATVAATDASGALNLRTSEEELGTSDPLNTSPSFRQDPRNNRPGTCSSFDFLGGEDSCDDDSEELYDSDQISELDEPFESSFVRSDRPPIPASATAGLEIDDDEEELEEDEGDFDDEDEDDVDQEDDEGAKDLIGATGVTTPSDISKGTMASTTPHQRNKQQSRPKMDSGGSASGGRTKGDGTAKRSRSSRSAQKQMGKIGKAVGGGISKVGNVGRSILHGPGATNNSSVASGNLVDDQGFTSDEYVCGYLNKISDGKWSKRSWHLRWFVLDRKRGVLSYYRHNPVNHSSNPSPRGNIIHIEEHAVGLEGSAHRRTSGSNLRTATAPVALAAGGASAAAFAASVVVKSAAKSDSGNTARKCSVGSGLTVTTASEGDTSQESTSSSSSPVIPLVTLAPATTTSAMNRVTGDDLLVGGSTTNGSRSAPTSPIGPSPQQQLLLEQQKLRNKQMTRCLGKNHPWYRGEFDLNMANCSLLFEKHLARNAPNRFFFQVSSLSLSEIDTKKSQSAVQFKLCADSEADFDRWTVAIAEAINRKHLDVVRTHSNSGAGSTAITGSNSAAAGSSSGTGTTGWRPLSHQQLYRQRLQREEEERKKKVKEEQEAQEIKLKQEEEEKVKAAAAAAVATISTTTTDATSSVATSSTPVPVPAGSPGRPRPRPSAPPAQWRLSVEIHGMKRCLVVGFLLNIVALKCAASEDNVLSKFFVCVVVSCCFLAAVYHPGSTAKLAPNSSAGGINLPRKSEAFGSSINQALLATDISQCADAKNCCLHKLPAVVSPLPAEIPASASPGATAEDLAAFAIASSSVPVKKFQMGFSLPSSAEKGPQHSWSFTKAETFSVRSLEYKKTKRKQASLPALFEFLGADLIQTDYKIDWISQRVEFPSTLTQERLFIINAQLPNYSPSMFGDPNADGPGFSLVLYWKIPQEIVQEIAIPTEKTSATIRLFKRFLEAGNDSSLTDRFKVIAQVTNQEESGLTGMGKKLLNSHNATPVLTRPQHRIYHHGNISEIDVDIHTFSYIARRGIHSLIDKTSTLVIDIGFVLQGETDHELPEQILGCCRLDRVGIQEAMTMP